eukprot:scaffold130188_cov28-Tisochrysis_lutea.AAC.11
MPGEGDTAEPAGIWALVSFAPVLVRSPTVHRRCSLSARAPSSPALPAPCAVLTRGGSLARSPTPPSSRSTAVLARDAPPRPGGVSVSPSPSAAIWTPACSPASPMLPLLPSLRAPSPPRDRMPSAPRPLAPSSSSASRLVRTRSLGASIPG